LPVGRKNFFFEKKKQKTFICCRGLMTRARLKKKKFFGSFFKKERSFEARKDGRHLGLVSERSKLDTEIVGLL